MNELQLPPAPSLPAEVRERALRTVLEETATPRRRLAPLVAAAAVVLTLAVSTTAAITSTGADSDDPRPADQPVSGPPARIGDDDLDEAINRCAAAVNASEHRAEYPPTAEWRVTDVVQRDWHGFWGGVTLAINGSFVCDTDPYGLRVTTVGGRPAGEVQVAALSSWQLVLFNPQRLPVEADREEGQERTSTEPYQILSIHPDPDDGPDDVDWSSRRLVVHGSYDGPIPDPGSPRIEARDRLGTGEPTPGQPLEDCVRAALPATKYAPPQQQEMVLRQEAREHTPPALVGRVAGSWATYCYDDPEGPVSGGNTLEDAPVTETRIVTSDRRWTTERGPDVLIVVLMTVAPDVERVEIAARPGPRPDPAAPSAPCTLQDGLALCMLRADHPGNIRDDGAVDVLPYIGGEATPLPVP
jgi:hypothetical protein